MGTRDGDSGVGDQPTDPERDGDRDQNPDPYADWGHPEWVEAIYAAVNAIKLAGVVQHGFVDLVPEAAEFLVDEDMARALLDEARARGYKWSDDQITTVERAKDAAFGATLGAAFHGHPIEQVERLDPTGHR